MSDIDFEFDAGNLLSKLREKDFKTDIYDSEYPGTLKARGYVDSSEKGVYSGVMETQTSGQTHSLVTFFKVSYLTGSLKMWNSNKKELRITTQGLNRVFRNKEVLFTLQDLGMKQLVYRAQAYEESGLSSSYSTTTGYHYTTPLGYNIKDSLQSGMEVAYLTAKNLGAIVEQDSKLEIVNFEALRVIYRLARDFYEQDISYKKILKYLGLTKGIVKNTDTETLLSAIGHIQLPRRRRSYEYNYSDTSYEPLQKNLDYSTGHLVDKPAWFRTARAYLDIGNAIKKYASEVGYTTSTFEAIKEVVNSHKLAESIKQIKHAYPNKEINLDKIIKYLYVDITMHQGISTFANAVSLYLDYTTLVEHIKGFTVFPRYLTVAHDIASKALKKTSSEEDEIAIHDFTSTFSSLEGIYKVDTPKGVKEYPLVLLRSGSEIVEEATNQSNCLASYVRNVAQGKDIILSLKNSDEYQNTGKLKSFVSVQLHVSYDDEGNFKDLSLVQAYKTFNNSLNSSDMKVLKGILDSQNVLTDKHITGYGVANVEGYTIVKKGSLSKVLEHEEVASVTEDENVINKYISRI